MFAKERKLMIFAHIDPAAGAQKIGKTLRPTELLATRRAAHR